jgi:hypothetical protein
MCLITHYKLVTLSPITCLACGLDLLSEEHTDSAKNQSSQTSALSTNNSSASELTLTWRRRSLGAGNGSIPRRGALGNRRGGRLSDTGWTVPYAC